MENELEKVLGSKFFCPSKFAQEIESLVHGETKMSYIDAIIYFCEMNKIDIESVPKLISKPLKDKIKFTKEKYDYHKYCGKSRATVQSFYKRKDRFWFEKLARNKDDKEVVEFFISNFITCTDPGKLWIGELIREGEVRYVEWKKRTQSLSYIFKEEMESLLSGTDINTIFAWEKGHPTILKKYLGDEISIETLVILDKILTFRAEFDSQFHIFKFATMDDQEKRFHVAMLEKLLEKQRVLYTRLSLSDDPEAKQMKEKILESATMMGLPPNVDMSVIFGNMSNMLKNMKQHLDIDDTTD